MTLSFRHAVCAFPRQLVLPRPIRGWTLTMLRAVTHCGCHPLGSSVVSAGSRRKRWVFWQEVGQLKRQGEQLQPRRVVLEPPTRQLGPLEGVLALLDPLFRRPPAVVEADGTLR
jgi:hypothetical protein